MYLTNYGTKLHNFDPIFFYLIMKPQILSVRSAKQQSIISNGYCYQHRPLTYTPWSRQNWKQLKIKIHTYFSNIESDFILLHKPFEVT